MNTRDIEAFLAVVDAGSIMAAAARLHLTQPAVTRRIQGLEEALGMTLLDRQSKPLKPTAAGRDAYELGRRVLGSVLDLHNGLAANGSISGELRLGVTPSQSDDTLSDPLDRLRSAYPELSLRVTTAWSHELVEQVESSRIDAGLVYLPSDSAIPPALNAEELARNTAIIVAPKGLVTRKRPVLGDLAEQPWVLSQDGCGYRRVVRQAIARAGLPFVVAVETFNSELRMSLIARGLGVGITTESSLQRSKYRDKVEVLDLRDFKAEIRVWLVHRAETGRLAAPLAVLGTAMKEMLAKQAKSAGRQAH